MYSPMSKNVKRIVSAGLALLACALVGWGLTVVGRWFGIPLTAYAVCFAAGMVAGAGVLALILGQPVRYDLADDD